MSVRWFGGRGTAAPGPAHTGTGCTGAGYPAGACALGRDVRTAWVCGDWPSSQAATVQGPGPTVAVLGRARCDVEVLEHWVRHGVPDSAVTALSGGYTVVEITDEATVVLTDPGWVQPIYTATTADGAPLWGSSAVALAALIGADVDDTWLHAHLRPAHSTEPGSGTGARSAFAGVTAVPPGARLTVSASGTTIRPLATAGDPSSGPDRPADRLRGAMQGAVAEIAAGASSTGQAVAADCSGGMDSTSLAMLLAQCRTARAEELRHAAVAVTVHPAGTTAGGDLDYARAAVAYARTGLAGLARTVEHLLCPLDDRHLPYGRMGELVPATDEPAPSTVAIARFDAELALLAGRGVGDLVTGDGGDTLLGPQPGYLPDLAATRTLHSQAQLLRHALGWARLRRTAVWPLLAQARAAAARGETGEAARTRTAMRVVARTARADAQITEQLHGITLHNPFTDPTVVDAALAVPGPLRAAPGDYKPVLRQAMAGLLPESVTGRRTKGDFTPDQYRGLRTHLQALTGLVDGELAARGLIDPDRYRALLTRAAAGAPGIGFHQLNPVLATEVWLRALDQRPAAARWITTDEDPRPAGSTHSRWEVF
ncbi:Asparagine synthetase [glutamine-hydrolyzing] [Pseudonocardia sp. Ae717_Ps2]|uniref:albusnodin/ikarugamycin family macrolactam cyclase n=1 Tax=Pseudonocardia sp. Ae717_Ps2 TaxID=1885573 RepID=UPI00094A9F93|nr:albusnodin/ikarugamycin family macrolactam cyclase [Pseudonocardia sp. Ae717_Ps2]OLM28609.1 Asparagine synthetase [glutamine-hydrolyzing] [Pseudonocardia sp. Ae717_Ps2]